MPVSMAVGEPPLFGARFGAISRKQGFEFNSDVAIRFPIPPNVQSLAIGPFNSMPA